MEGFDLTFSRGRVPDFDSVPPAHRVRLFGVDYVHLKGLQNGDMFITRHGWPWARSLLPEHWFVGEQFSKRGRALAGATGAVYRVPVPHRARDPLQLVVKFSRFGQDAGDMNTGYDVGLSAELREHFAGSEFLPPFEEFANVQALRAHQSRDFATQLPLAVYSPPTRWLAWQLGRKPHLQSRFTYRLRQDQSGSGDESQAVRYDWERIYILLYSWLDGVDAEQAGKAGLLRNNEMEQMAQATAEQLAGMGWLVLDHKPRHVILRPVGNGYQLLHRGGRPAFGLIDYELLLPMPSAEELG